MKPLFLVRQSRYICVNEQCGMNTSRSCHAYCYKCAEKGSIEYNYHKLRLPKKILEQYYVDLYNHYFK